MASGDGYSYPPPSDLKPSRLQLPAAPLEHSQYSFTQQSFDGGYAQSNHAARQPQHWGYGNSIDIGYQYANQTLQPPQPPNTAFSTQSVFHTTTSASSSPYATAGPQQRPASVNPLLFQHYPSGFTTRQGQTHPQVTGQPPAQTAGQHVSQSQSVQYQQQHRGWVSPRVAQASIPVPSPQQQHQHQERQQQQHQQELLQGQQRQYQARQLQLQQQAQDRAEDSHYRPRHTEEPRNVPAAQHPTSPASPAQPVQPLTAAAPALPAMRHSSPNAMKSKSQAQEKEISKPKPRLYLPQPKPRVAEPPQPVVGELPSRQSRTHTVVESVPKLFHQPHAAQHQRYQLQQGIQMTAQPAQQAQHSASVNPAPVASVAPVSASAAKATVPVPRTKSQPSALSEQQQQASAGPQPMANPSHSESQGASIDRAAMDKRMREVPEMTMFYQSKDPSAFQAVWDSVQKETVAPAAIMSDSEPSQLPTPSVGPSTTVSPAVPLSNSVQPQMKSAEQGPAPIYVPPQQQMQFPAHSPQPHGRVLGEVEDHQDQLFRETNKSDPQHSTISASGPFSQNPPAAIYQQAPYGTPQVLGTAQHQSLWVSRGGKGGGPGQGGKQPGSVSESSTSKQPSPSHAIHQVQNQPPMPMPRVSNRIPQPEPETLVIATAAATFLASAGKPISVEYLIGFLQRTNNFAAMCEHFDSLGYKYNREDLAKHIVEAVSQARAQQGFSMIAPPPRAVQHPIVLAQSVPATKQPPMTESVVHKTSLPQLPVPNKAPPHQPTAVPVKQSFVPTNSVMIGDSPSLTGPFGNIGNDAMDIEGPTTSTTDANQNGKATASGVLSTFSGLGRKSGGLFARTKAHVNEDEAKAPAALDHGTEAPEESTEPKQPLAEKISRKNAARVSKYDSTNIAKTILVIANRHPTEKGLNAHLLPLKENFPGQIEWDSDLSTIRWDIIDTEPIAVDNDMDGDDEGDGDSNAATNAVPVVPRTGSSRALTTISGIASMPNNFCATHTTSAPHQYAPPSSARVNHKRRTVNAASSAIDSPMEGPSKKRKNDHPPSNGDPFKHYACQWTHCGVKLHNFENLKRHMKLHKKKNELFNGYPCHWAGCVRPPTAQQINAAKGRRGGLSPMVWDFGTEAEWERHMEIHVEALKQSAGVGPPALSAGHPHSHHRMKQIPLTSEKDQESGTSDVDYLSDHKGAPITPVAKLSIDTHRFVPPTGFKPNRQFSIAHGNTPQRNKKYEALLEKAKILGAGYECPCAPEPTRELGPPVWRVLPPDWLPEK